ncbi:MAG: BcpO-related WXXGXW repeat protein [Kofleriaceae bacterium]|nr:BcpO-related WXXGXW repeat protein [Kofleriaceae bacterium]
MMGRYSPAVALLLVAACGGSSSKAKPKDPRDAELEAAAAKREALLAEQPKSPYETREKTAYRPDERCGQGPYRIETDSLRAHYGEEIEVYACGDHSISGNYRLDVQRKTSDTSERAFGWSRDNEACKGNRATVVDAGTASSSGGSARGGSGPAKKGSAVAPATKLKSRSLTRVGEFTGECKVRSYILDTGYRSWGDVPALEGHLVLDIWSDEPLDLQNLVFVIEKKAVVADMTVERWKKFLDDEDAWHKRYEAFVDGEVAAGRTTLVDMKVKTPPPPPPRIETLPPKPSKNARWIPGYWQYADNDFHWLAGMWDVPPEDVAKELTVHAPSPPPEVRVEQPPEPQPIATAVWTPGQWQWDGRMYVWVPGAWRVPPSRDHRWQPARWSVSVRGGAVFVPGGWHIRIGR